MAKCAACGRSGWLVQTYRKGICGHCQDRYDQDCRKHKPRIMAAMHVVSGGEPAGRRLRQIEEAIESCQVLEHWEAIGFEPCSPKPSNVHEHLVKARAACLDDFVEEELIRARVKARGAASKSGRSKAFSRAIDIIKELAAHPELSEVVHERVREIEREGHSYVFRLLVEKAEASEAKGRRQQAVDDYMEALEYLRGNRGQLAGERIQESWLRHAIERLGGRIPLAA